VVQIAELVEPTPTPFWQLLKQVGVNHVVSLLEQGEQGARWLSQESGNVDRAEGVDALGRMDGGASWELEPLRRLKERYEQAGLELAVIEDYPPMDRIRLGLPGRDEQIEWFCTQLRSMGALGIPVLCYSFMAVFSWARTGTQDRSRGDALVTSYDHSLMTRAPTEAGTVSEEQMWENFEYFLLRVVPVAEEAGVKLALHPDDPPISPIRDLARIMRSVEAFQRVVDLVPSDANGITLCQGNFTLMADDLPAVIRRFGEQGKIFFVHFRDVRGTPERFIETFHDDGQTDMLACMRAYRDIGYDGVMRSDHVPTLAGDQNEKPGYSTLGRLFAIGYMTGLREAAYDGRKDGE
jgi:mannonate dehydratase